MLRISGRLLFDAVCSIGIPTSAAVAAVGPMDKMRILKQVESVQRMPQQQLLPHQSEMPLEKLKAARGIRSLWLGAGCGSLSCLLACTISLSATQMLRCVRSSAESAATDVVYHLKREDASLRYHLRDQR